jgi:hypothetical protein
VNLPTLPPVFGSSQAWRDRLRTRAALVRSLIAAAAGIVVGLAITAWGATATAWLLVLLLFSAGAVRTRSIDIQRRQILRTFGGTLGAFAITRLEAGMTYTDRRRRYGDRAIRAPGWPSFGRWVPKWDCPRRVLWLRARHITSLWVRPAGGMNPQSDKLHADLAVCAGRYWRTDPNGIQVTYQLADDLIQISRAPALVIPTGYTPPNGHTPSPDGDGFSSYGDYGDDGPEPGPDAA